ncbi:RagB/SusD family nutrient uptake outer membrane protein [Bacteroides sp.]
MKNIAKLFIGIGIVAFTTSCSDFLDQTSPSEITGDAVFNKVSYTQEALNKVYSGLTLDNTYGCRLPLNFSTNSDIELVDALDETTTRSNNERGACNYNPTPSWDKLDKTWSAMYEIAENATTVVEGIANSPILQTNTSDRTKMLRFKGEALVLRAMIYYDLIKNFGDIPAKFETTKSDGSNIYLEKSDRDDTMERLLTDLDEAAGYLPWAGEEGYTTERITKGFAHGLAARIALSYAGYSIRETAKSGYYTLPEYSDGTYPTQRPGDEKRRELYQIALNHTSEIIKSGKHKLNYSFDNLWTLSNMLTLDASQENLYEVAHGLNYSGEMGYTAGVRVNGSTSRFGIKGNSSGKVKLTAALFWSFDDMDERRDVTCATFEIKEGTGGKTEENMQKNTPLGIYVAKWDVRKMESNSSWLNTVLASTDKVGYGVNWIAMRYSDVLLMYAEALNELQGCDVAGPANQMTARQALKEVHNRAFSDKSYADNYVDAIPNNDFFDAIVQERAWEFAGEGIRKYDLIRWGLLSEKIEQAVEDYKKVNMEAPEMLYYKMTTDAKGNSIIDMSSVCWRSEPSNTADYKSIEFWGQNKDDESKNKILTDNLPYISAGLNATVKYRHLFPLGNTSISDSKGTIKNSYGF